MAMENDCLVSMSIVLFCRKSEMVDEGSQTDVVSEDLRRFEVESLGLLHRFGTESSDGRASCCTADQFWSDVDMA